MKLILFYVGIVLGGYALYYASMDLTLIISTFFAQATTLLLVSTRPKADVPVIGAVGIFAMLFFIGLAFTPLSYAAVPLMPLLLAAAGAGAMAWLMRPKPVFQ